MAEQTLHFACGQKEEEVKVTHFKCADVLLARRTVKSVARVPKTWDYVTHGIELFVKRRKIDTDMPASPFVKDVAANCIHTFRCSKQTNTGCAFRATIKGVVQ